MAQLCCMKNSNDALQAQKKLLEADVIKQAQSVLVSSIVLVPEEDGILQICVDYWQLNAPTIVKPFPLPRTDDCAVSLEEAELFATLSDLLGYWQL